MKRISILPEPYGLRTRFVLSILLSVLVCSALCLSLFTLSDTLYDGFEQRMDLEHRHLQRQGRSLQQYIDRNQISGSDLSALKQWERRQPVILLELYDEQGCIYSSLHDEADSALVQRTVRDDLDHSVALQLSDTTVTAIMYSDYTYQFYVFRSGVSVLLSLGLFILLFLHSTRRMIHYICRLNREVQILEGGDLEYEVCVQGNDEITDLARSMNRMRLALRQQMETEQQLHDANRRLITQMSHDLRTPLTTVLLYLEILRSHRYETGQELEEYLTVIDTKAHHLKTLTDHLFQYALDGAAEGNGESVGMEQALSGPLNRFRSELTAIGFVPVFQWGWSSAAVQINPEYLERMLENIASNLRKYAEPSTEVVVEVMEEGKYCGFSVINTCAACHEPVETYGISIQSIRTMMEQMNGVCSIEQTETSFCITLLFPKQ